MTACIQQRADYNWYYSGIIRENPMSLMALEIAESPDVARQQAVQVASTLKSVVASLRAADPALIVTCARGSSDHAATYAKYLFETMLDIPVASHAPSVASIYKQKLSRLNRALFLAISQSGASPDLILSAEAARKAGATVVALVNAEGAPLGQKADFLLPLSAGEERSVAATKSCIATLLMIARLAAHWQEDEALLQALAEVPDQLEQAINCDWAPALPVLQQAKGLFVIGRGLTLGIAQEAALKLKETSGLHAEGFSAAEVKHGPMALVNRDMPVLVFAPADATREGLDILVADFAARGAPVIVAGADMPGALRVPTVEKTHAALAPILSLASFYGFANALSLARGFDPDRPPHLLKVTKTL
jgi:glutamine---fructose-6-phosphate transaminase (isomerizing)